MSKQRVILGCGHSTVVSHDKGERVLTCSYCFEQSIVTAAIKEIVVYSVHLVQPQLSLPFRAE
jgi:hypothetical protein